MFKLRRPRPVAETVQFCDACAQVCTAACRTDARFDAARTQAAVRLPFIH